MSISTILRDGNLYDSLVESNVFTLDRENKLHFVKNHLLTGSQMNIKSPNTENADIHKHGKA
jgi:hypothetical protein